MKRKSLFLISTLTFLSSILTPPSLVHAQITYNGEQYYTAADLLAIGQEVEAAKIAECGENYDFWCGQDVLENLFMTDAKYQIYDVFQHGNLVFSAINPDAHTAKVIYRDKDDMFWGGEPRSYDLAKLCLYWLDPSIDTFDNSILEKYIKNIEDGTYDSDKIHVLFFGNQTSDFEWLTPNQESTMPLNDVGHSENHLLRFYTKSNGESFGIFDFSDCFNGPYEDGMECTKIYGKDMTYLIAPKIWQEVAEVEPDPEVDPEPEQPEPEQPEQPGQSEEPEGPENPELPEDPEELEQTEGRENPEDPEEPKESEDSVEPGQPNPTAEEPEPVIKEEPLTLDSETPEPVVSTELTPDPEPASEQPEQTEPDPERIISAEIKPLGVVASASAEPKAETSVKLPLSASSNASHEVYNDATTADNIAEEGTDDFPWWLIAMATSVAFLAIWLLIPARRKKE